MKDFFLDNPANTTALAAILAPAITALIHSIKEFRISKMSHTVESRISQFIVFVNSYSDVPNGVGYANFFFTETMKLIPLCHRRHTRILLFKLANEVKKNGASKEADFLYGRCIKLLSKEF